MSMQLGVCADGRVLAYDAGLYEFSLERKPVSIHDVRALDARAQIHWRANEMRDWLARVNADDLAACHERALIKRNAVSYDSLSAEERVQADAARDDSVIAGKIVDADPALVHAVANSLIEQGLLKDMASAAPIGHSEHAETGQPGDFNPLAVIDLPRGMESLSQLERAKGPNRKMTRSEQRLMKKILRNDDKAKERRERREAASAVTREQTEEQSPASQEDKA